MWKNRWISWRYKRLLPSEHFNSSVCFSLFPSFALFGAFWLGFSSIFRFVCFFSVNEWMKDSLTIPLAVRCLFFLAVDVSYLVSHTPYRWRRVNIFCSLSDWYISGFFSFCAHKNTETNNSSELLHIMNTGWFDNWFQIGRSPWSKSKESSL